VVTCAAARVASRRSPLLESQMEEAGYAAIEEKDLNASEK